MKKILIIGLILTVLLSAFASARQISPLGADRSKLFWFPGINFNPVGTTSVTDIINEYGYSNATLGAFGCGRSPCNDKAIVADGKYDKGFQTKNYWYAGGGYYIWEHLRATNALSAMPSNGAITFWMKAIALNNDCTDGTGAHKDCVIFSMSGNGNSSENPPRILRSDNGTVYLSDIKSWGSNKTLNDLGWHHYAITWESNMNRTFWFDGQMVTKNNQGNLTKTGGYIMTYYWDNGFIFANYAPYGNPDDTHVNKGLPMTISDLAIWNVTLNQTEIEDLADIYSIYPSGRETYCEQTESIVFCEDFNFTHAVFYRDWYVFQPNNTLSPTSSKNLFIPAIQTWMYDVTALWSKQYNPIITAEWNMSYNTTVNDEQYLSVVLYQTLSDHEEKAVALNFDGNDVKSWLFDPIGYFYNYIPVCTDCVNPGMNNYKVVMYFVNPGISGLDKFKYALFINDALIDESVSFTEDLTGSNPSINRIEFVKGSSTNLTIDEIYVYKGTSRFTDNTNFTLPVFVANESLDTSYIGGFQQTGNSLTGTVNFDCNKYPECCTLNNQGVLRPSKINCVMGKAFLSFGDMLLDFALGNLMLVILIIAVIMLLVFMKLRT